MRERSSIGQQRPDDLDGAVLRAVQEARGQRQLQPQREKNPAAVALGRLGGLKGGNARAAKLSAKQRSEIARHAALVRWQAAERGGGH